MMLKFSTQFERLVRNKVKLILLVFLLINFTLVAQAQRVDGVVTDSETSEPVPGVNVIKKGTAQGTVTDINGAFQIDAGSGDVLIFSAVGYVTEEIPVGTQSTINVSFAPDVTALQEIVVTGYTEQRKRDITGAVAVVDLDAMNEIKAPSFGQKLAGRAPGVTTSTSGQPGDGTNIRIRGISSITGNNDPLIIIDGVQVQGDKALNGLNPNDIESMQILKDASAAAIYGARANTGVVIITTKQGKPGKTKVTYDGYVGSQKAVATYGDFMIKDPRDYARIQMARNPGMIPYYGGDPDNPVIPRYFFPTATDDNGTPDDTSDDFMIPNTNPGEYSFPDNLIMESNQEGTNWSDELFRTSLITEHHLGLSGGNDNATYHASVGYLNQEGTMKHTGFERFSARLNSRMNAGRFTFGESISLARSEQVIQRGQAGNEQNTISQTFLMNSIVPVRDVAGNYAGAKTNGFSNAKNPVAFAETNADNVDVDIRMLANLFGEFKIAEPLKIRTSYSVDYRDLYQPRMNFPRFEDREVNSNNSYGETRQSTFNWTWTNTLEFNKTFADVHAVKILAGHEAVRNQFKQLNAQVNNLAFTDPNVRYQNLTYSSFNSMGSQERIVTYQSFFGKIDYEYSDKYLLSATLRRDAVSDFTKDNRVGIFPAVSAGWRISAEPFMQGITVIDDLKIRGGWGVTGNAFIPRGYNTYDQWGGRNTYDAGYDIAGTNSSYTRGFTRFTYGNVNTRWEENTSMNIGFDASLVNGKVTLVFDWYKREIDGLIYNPPFPGQAGNANQYFQNVGAMENTGIDLGIGYRGRITDELGFNTFVNFSHYKNEITRLDGEQDRVFPAGIDKRFGEVNMWQVGSPISSFYGYQNDGFFQSQAEIDALDQIAQQNPDVVEYQPGAAPGRFKRKDINGDGHIDDNDLGVIGNPHPDFTLGWNLGFDYKNLDLSMFFFASVGNDIYNYNKVFTHLGQFNANAHKDVLTKAWTEENPEGAEIPKLDGGDTFASRSSDFYVEDGSYLRLQNISLGYTFPNQSIPGFESLRIYIQAQNLFTITGYGGVDPALSNVDIGATVDGRRQNDGWMGFDLGNYPSSRIYTIGVSAAF